jgi:hypothetical protein
VPFGHPELLEDCRVEVVRAGTIEHVADALGVNGVGAGADR